jgi:hypothetical protein
MQPSCFFRRRAWDAAGPLDESRHLAMDVDLWFRMLERGMRFQKIDRLLSTSLAHAGAKTTALQNSMVVDASIVIIKAGGERFVRGRLEELATSLAYYESSFKRIVNHPLVRLVAPLGRALLRPEGRAGGARPGA